MTNNLEMEIHEVKFLKSRGAQCPSEHIEIVVLKVPGGWIYHFRDTNPSSCFVPFQ